MINYQVIKKRSCLVGLKSKMYMCGCMYFARLSECRSPGDLASLLNEPSCTNSERWHRKLAFVSAPFVSLLASVSENN